MTAEIDDSPLLGSELAASFARALRVAGIAVPLDAVITFTRGLDAVGPGSLSAIYWTARVTMVHRPEDIARFDRAFEAFFLGAGQDFSLQLALETTPRSIPADGSGEEAVLPESALAETAAYSAEEILRHKDFARCTPEELAKTAALIAKMRPQQAWRRSRRFGPPRARRGRPDVRQTLRRALRTDGEAIRQLHRRRRTRPRRLVLICDVSASMQDYARPLLRFLHVAIAARPRGEVEAFALGTRLTRLSRALQTADADLALERASATVNDHSGGTRLGEGIAAFNRDYGAPGMARGSTVVVLSDGWDRGNPELLAASMERLSRLAHRVVWVNPLKASPGYEPIARGMAAALPHVDTFIEGHNLASLEELATVLAQ